MLVLAMQFSRSSRPTGRGRKDADPLGAGVALQSSRDRSLKTEERTGRVINSGVITVLTTNVQISVMRTP